MDRRQSGLSPTPAGGIRLDIRWKGARFRRTIPGLDASKKAHWKTAENMLGAARHEIALGVFDPSKYFPDSKLAKQFRPGAAITLSEKLDEWLRDRSNDCERSTYRDYVSAVNQHLRPTFGELTLEQIKSADIREWRAGLTISNKRINNIMIPLRGVLQDAYADELISSNPAARIKNLPKRAAEPDPFTPDERDALLAACDGSTKPLFQFAFWTGVRTSELIAMEWEDVDLAAELAYVRRTRTRVEQKSRAKTELSIRTLQLLPAALEALQEIKGKRSSPSGPIFIDPKTQLPWKHDGPIRKRAWSSAVKRSGVRYRTAYVTRHTFASTTLSLGFHPMWVAQQMGHRDWGMIRKTYGRWIPELDVSVAANIDKLRSKHGQAGV